MAAQKLIIDTDPGIDDAMAILFACLHEDLDLVGLTSIFGNVTTDIATRNALALVEMAGAEIPVARGAEKPLVQAARPVAAEVHGVEGFGDVPPFAPAARADQRTAARFICDTVAANPGEVVLCPIGPLTNLALALEHDPTIVDKVKSVTVMGGAMVSGGNVTEHAEANIWQDPHAARAVFSAPWEVTMVGLDVTEKVMCTDEHFTDLAERAPKLGGFLDRAARFYFDFHLRHDGFYGCHMHDPTAVISILRPDLFRTERQRVDVIADGAEAGKTVTTADESAPHTHICVAVDEDAVRSQFLSTLGAGY